MKCEIRHRKKNALMKRDEVMVSIDHSGKPTPNRKEVMAEAARMLSTKPENLIVARISTSGGTSLSEARIYSYSKKDDIPEWKVKKFDARMAKIKPKAAEKPAEEAKPPEEAPAEPAPEEKPSEANPTEEAKEKEPKHD